MAAPPLSDINLSTSLDGCDKPATSTAPHPFNDPKADLIIRSCDNIHFYIHKSLLSIVSPVSESMLALLDGTPPELYDDRPCMLVTDDSDHLLCLFSWCDPRCEKISPTLDNLPKMLSIAKKYGVDSMFANAQKDLLAHSSVGSLRAYAIAVRFRLDNAVKKAAQATLQLPFSLACHNSPPFKHISGFAIQNLHNYQFECKEAVRDLIASESWAENMKAAARYLAKPQENKGKPHTHGLEYFSLKRLKVVGGGALWISTAKTTPWWSDYVQAMVYILNDRPSVPPSLLQGMQKSISFDKCNQCRKYGYERLNTVSAFLVNKIDKTVSKVPFEVKY